MPPAEPEPGCWLHPALAIAPSRIAGNGLLARTPIGAGMVVSRLGGRLVSSAELVAIVASSETYVYSITVDEDLQLVLPGRTPNHFANHSCDPNLWWSGEYTLVARRDIAAGEEVTCDYATSSNHPDFVLACHCETYRCRQLITGDDWQIPQLQQRYAAHFVPYLQRLVDGAQ